MTEDPTPSIWRNIGSIPAALFVWWLGIRLVDHWVMSFLRGEDLENDKFLFFIPVEPIAVWMVPILQYLVVPGVCVYTAACVATSKRTHFAVAIATLLVAMTLLASLLISFGSLDVPGVMIFRLWLCTVIGWASIAVSLGMVFEEFKGSGFFPVKLLERIGAG